MKNELINLCLEIKKKNSCNGCGGKFNNYTCRYCGSVSRVLEDLINKLSNCLANMDSLDIDVLNALFSIKGLNISIVDEVISKYNYRDFLIGKYDEMKMCINNNLDLSDELCHYVIFFLDNDLFIDDSEREHFINILMKKWCLNDLDCVLEDKLALVRSFVLMVTRKFSKNAKCIYSDLDINVLGSANPLCIYLNEECTREMIELSDVEGILDTIFHEATHIYQYQYVLAHKLNKVSYGSLILIKEKFLRRDVSNYYEDNYDSIYSETEARYNGAFMVLSYMRMIGVQCLNEDYFRNIMLKEKNELFNCERIINGDKISVDEAFCRYVTDCSLLVRYPVLGIQFKSVDGKICLKSRDEILDDYERYKSGELVLNGSKEEIDFLYEYLISNARKIKISK